MIELAHIQVHLLRLPRPPYPEETSFLVPFGGHFGGYIPCDKLGCKCVQDSTLPLYHPLWPCTFNFSNWLWGKVADLHICTLKIFMHKGWVQGLNTSPRLKYITNSKVLKFNHRYSIRSTMKSNAGSWKIHPVTLQ